MNIYNSKIACLVSLIMQVKSFSSQKINDLLEVERLESFLDIPEISDRNWESECPANQRAFLFFLNTNISVYERMLELMKGKEWKDF